MRSKDELMFDLKLVDNLVGSSYKEVSMELYFAGGAACILAGYIDRMTRDFDFVDIGYSSRLSKVLKLLDPYDLLTEELSAIPLNFKDRVERIDGFTNISVYIFSKEDIIASKIDRLSEKDFNDIDILINDINISILKKSIKEITENIVYNDRRERYINNIAVFEKKYKMRVYNNV